MHSRVMRVGLHWLKVSWTHNLKSCDTLTSGGDTLLFSVGMVGRRTSNALEVYVTVTLYKQTVTSMLQNNIYVDQVKDSARRQIS